MGCSIHYAFEELDKNKWKFIGDKYNFNNVLTRDYIFFSWLGGVTRGCRGFVTRHSYASQSGLPHDLSSEIREMCEDTEYHSRGHALIVNLINEDYGPDWFDKEILFRGSDSSTELMDYVAWKMGYEKYWNLPSDQFLNAWREVKLVVSGGSNKMSKYKDYLRENLDDYLNYLVDAKYGTLRNWLKRETVWFELLEEVYSAEKVRRMIFWFDN